jgi:hypothetical protein
MFSAFSMLHSILWNETCSAIYIRTYDGKAANYNTYLRPFIYIPCHLSVAARKTSLPLYSTNGAHIYRVYTNSEEKCVTYNSLTLQNHDRTCTSGNTYTHVTKAPSSLVAVTNEYKERALQLFNYCPYALTSSYVVIGVIIQRAYDAHI